MNGGIPETKQADGIIVSFQEGEVWVNDGERQFQVVGEEAHKSLTRLIVDKRAEKVLGYSWIAGELAHGVWELPAGTELPVLDAA